MAMAGCGWLWLARVGFYDYTIELGKNMVNWF